VGLVGVLGAEEVEVRLADDLIRVTLKRAACPLLTRRKRASRSLQ
jgi:hypothetical protein